MLGLDHIAITVNSLDESISFYTKFGYKLIERFSADGYNWATLKLNNHSLELFEMTKKNEENFDHIAYSYDSDEEAVNLINQLGYKKENLDIFYGDLNRKSFFMY